MKKGDKILIVAIVVIVCIMGVFVMGNQFYNTDDTYVEVYQNNELVGEYEFGDVQKIEFVNELNDEEYNIVYIDNDVAYMYDANCRDELCVKTPPISRVEQSVVCLPHKTIIKVVAR